MIKLDKLSGYDTACNWRSIIIPVAKGRNVGHIDYVIVKTKNQMSLKIRKNSKLFISILFCFSQKYICKIRNHNFMCFFIFEANNAKITESFHF